MLTCNQINQMGFHRKFVDRQLVFHQYFYPHHPVQLFAVKIGRQLLTEEFRLDFRNFNVKWEVVIFVGVETRTQIFYLIELIHLHSPTEILF